MRLLLLVLCAVADGSTCSCQPSSSSTDEQLQELAKWNCLRITQAGLDYSQLAQNYGQAVSQSWKQRLQQAEKMCAGSSGDLMAQAKSACCAWGDVLMLERECCNVPGPPYCVNKGDSKLGHASVLVLAVLMALAAALLPYCCPSFYAPGRLAAPVAQVPEEAQEALRQLELGELATEMAKTWDASTLRDLPLAAQWRQRCLECLSKMQAAFDFQEDSVKNQLEHLLSLWRSHLSVICDRELRRRPEISEEDGLLEQALEELHGDLLQGFRAWRQQFQVHQEEQLSFQRTRWCSCGEERYPPSLRCLEEVSLFLLVWGEAGNLRFMPELLYFITHIMLEADSSCHFDGEPRVQRGIGPGHARSGAFLVDLVRPIYRVIFDEHYLSVSVKPDGKDDKKLRPTFDRYLPADAANYDDWNELFQDIPRLSEKFQSLLRKPRGERYRYLKLCDWRRTLMGVKTHRELHSWWGVFAGTHRIWFLHLLLFFFSMFWVSSHPSAARGWQVALGGNSPIICLCFVGLIVPLHLFLWALGRFFTAGKALCTTQLYVSLLSQLLLMCIPIITFFWVRILDAEGLDVRVATWVHLFVCFLGIFVILLQPCSLGDGLRRPTRSAVSTKAFRWLFWLAVLAVKFIAGLGSVGSIARATDELRISRPGLEALSEIPDFAFGPNWDKDMVEWLALWGTGLVCYVADTQYWFCLGCFVLGSLLALQQRGWRAITLVTEDSLAAVPQRFAERVVLAAPRGGQNRLRCETQGIPVAAAREQWYLKWFPDLWDRIIDFMHCEDKLDDFITGQLKFSSTSSEITMERLCQEVLQERQTFHPPLLFSRTSWSHRSLRRDLGLMPDEAWPWNIEVRWRLLAFARNLASEDLPRPFLTPYVPGLTVLIPHYGEQILLCHKDLVADKNDEEVPLIAWLEKRYHGDFTAFTSRMKALDRSWPSAGSRWDQYQTEHWEEICMWASLRSQTLWRTVEGLMLYLPALDCFHQMVGQQNRSSRLRWDAREVFTCMVSMQAYAHFNQQQYDHAEKLLERFARKGKGIQPGVECFQIAFIDHMAKGEAAADGIHEKQERRYYSCLIDPSCEKQGQKRVPRLRVELPGFPILGDGKGDNQNHAIIFSRGSIIQAIDANQGGYFEQMLLLPCALGEFRSKKGLNPRIVGFAEHITSDIGSLGDFAAGAETAFGTVLQRCYAFLGGRMHYGHPDMMNKEFMMQQGGVSKATKTVNLSEDIFAGMDFTLRGNGRNIVHREYLHVAKGRDLGFNTVLTFFSKLSAGTGEQLLTRQLLRLGHELDLPELLTFYYAHAGFYLTQFFLSKSVPLLVFIWLVAVLDDPERNFPALDPDDTDVSGALVIARMLITQFSWLLLLFILAQTAPLFLQVWLENSLLAAVLRVCKQMVTLAPLHFVFQAKIIGTYITNEITLGGAKYLPTGRGLPTQRRSFLRRLDQGGGLYNDYAVLALYDGAQLLLAALLVIFAGGLAVEVSLYWWLIALALTICSWLLAPFIFNPYQFAIRHFKQDLGYWSEFFFKSHGKYWEEWYCKTRLLASSGVRSSGVGIIRRALFLGCWYTILNQKVHMLTVIFEGDTRLIFSIGLVAAPPVGLSVLACLATAQLDLAWSALIVVLLDLLETTLYLWKLILVHWWKSCAVGLLLKFSLLSLCLEACECAFRLQRVTPPEWLRAWVRRWLYAHRMAQDLFVSSLILLLLSLGTLFCGCKSCGLHNILVYRDPGGVHKPQQAQATRQRGEATSPSTPLR